MNCDCSHVVVFIILFLERYVTIILMIGNISSFLSFTCIEILNIPSEPPEIARQRLSKRWDVNLQLWMFSVMLFYGRCILWPVWLKQGLDSFSCILLIYLYFVQWGTDLFMSVFLILTDFVRILQAYLWFIHHLWLFKVSLVRLRLHTHVSLSGHLFQRASLFQIFKKQYFTFANDFLLWLSHVHAKEFVSIIT